jgi:drug/metabolite transporter (DMT)-like permease
MISKFVIKKFHKWFGRLYVISLLWTVSSSLLIHKHGLPLPVIVSFSWVLIGTCAGWLFICAWKEIGKTDGEEPALRIIKTLHGISMFISWVNISGRIFSTDYTGFTCNATEIPSNSGPWDTIGILWWSVLLVLVPTIVGIIYSVCYYKTHDYLEGFDLSPICSSW